MSTFVALGNSKNPFPRLLTAVDTLAAAGHLPNPIVVQHGHSTFESRHCIKHDFLSMTDFDAAIAGARLIILQAGGGSVLTALRCGKVPVLVPRRASLGEVVDDHQIENARNLEALGGVVIAWDTDELIPCIKEALHRQEKTEASHESPAVIAMVSEDLRVIASLGKLR